MTNTTVDSKLPVADPSQVRRAVKQLLRAERKATAAVGGLYCLAALAGIGAPRLLGEIVDQVDAGASTNIVDLFGIGIAAFLIMQLLLNRVARYYSARLGERVLAHLREDFVGQTLTLPITTIEQAGTGELMTRSSGDVDTVGRMVRQALPELVISGCQVVFIIGAVFAVNPLLGLCALLGAPALLLVRRWYLRRSRAAYLRAGAASTMQSEALAATAEGAQTVEALDLSQQRIAHGDMTVSNSVAAQRATLYLRTVLFPVLDVAQLLPVAGALLFGGVMYLNELASLGAVVAATLYLQQLVEPLDQAFMWLESLQRGAASFARVRGIAGVQLQQRTSSVAPRDDQLVVRNLSYGYPTGPEVLHDVDFTIRPGEHLAVVGPSGAGKSTLGRLLAGVDEPGSGSIQIGGVEVTSLELTQLRGRVALLTQDHHVFIGSVRDNLLIAEPSATDTQLHNALLAVDAQWIDQLPAGLDTALAAGGLNLDAGRAQQLALARLVLADPHTLILDEATSLLDPTTARDTERSLAAVMRGRTVVSIAHRLHAAHDADRVLVLESGRISELGSHDELLSANGSYAVLWRSWHGQDY